jgi:hypothetical protein
MNRIAFRLAASLLIALAVIACGSTAPSASPSATGAGSKSSTPTTSTGASEPAEEPTTEATPAATAAAADGQTDTEWGRIWDTVPAAFPVFPDAAPSEEAATGPASAVYVVEGSKPDQIATWYQEAFETSGFHTDSLSGPFEDGGYILESSGDDPACRLSLTIAPLGGTASLTVLYGAACPHP